eukprot:g6696.t1
MLRTAKSSTAKGLTVNKTFVLHLFLDALPDEYAMAKHNLRHEKELTRAGVLKEDRIQGDPGESRDGERKGDKRGGASVPSTGRDRKERSSRSQGQGCGRGGGRGRSSSRGRGGRRFRGRGGCGGCTEGSGGVEERKGNSSGGTDGGGSGDYKFPGRCFRCGHRGHQMIDCTTSKNDFVPWCERCEGLGHTKGKGPTEETVLAQVVEQESDGDSVEAFCAVVGPPGKCGTVEVGLVGVEEQGLAMYVADTAVTCSMFRYADHFANYPTPIDLNEYHLAHGHAHEKLLRITAEQQGVQLTDGPLLLLGCSMSKGQVKQLLPLVDDEEGGEGKNSKDTSRQGWGGENDSENGTRQRDPGDGGGIPSSPPGGGDFGDGDDNTTDSRSSSSSDSSRVFDDEGEGSGGSDGGSAISKSSPSDAGGDSDLGGNQPGDPGGVGGGNDDPGNSENLEELKYDPTDDRYPSGREGKKLLRNALNAGPLPFRLERGRTRKQTRQPSAEEAKDPGDTPEPEEALLATILEIENGTEIVANYVSDSLVAEQWEEEQMRRKEEQTRGVEEIYRREMQEVFGREQQAFGAEVDASGSSQTLPDPQLSMTSPIGQKPSDVEAVPMTYKGVMCSKDKAFWEAVMKKEIDGHDKTGTFTKADVEAVPMTYKDVMCSKDKAFWEAAMKKEIDGHGPKRMTNLRWTSL